MLIKPLFHLTLLCHRVTPFLAALSGGGGNRTPVLHSFHTSFYIVSSLYSHNKQSYQNYLSQVLSAPLDYINSGLSSLSEFSEPAQLGKKVCATPSYSRQLAQIASRQLILIGFYTGQPINQSMQLILSLPIESSRPLYHTDFLFLLYLGTASLTLYGLLVICVITVLG